MKIVQAVNDAETVVQFYKLTKRRPNILISYAYMQGSAVDLAMTNRHMIDALYLDSGAFSVFTKRVSVSISEYLKYIQRYGQCFDVVFTLDDKFDDPQHNLHNQMFLEKGLEGKSWKPVPCIHDEEDPLGEIETYIKMGHQYIALGSLGPKKKISPQVLDSVKEKYPDHRFHLFGSLNRDVLLKYRPYSADASSWAAAAAKGSFYYWDAEDEKEYLIDVESVEKQDKASGGKNVLYRNFHHRKQLEEFLRETFQFTYQDLLSKTLHLQMVNMYFFTQLEEIINNTPQAPKSTT